MHRAWEKSGTWSIPLTVFRAATAPNLEMKLHRLPCSYSSNHVTQFGPIKCKQKWTWGVSPGNTVIFLVRKKKKRFTWPVPFPLHSAWSLEMNLGGQLSFCDHTWMMVVWEDRQWLVLWAAAPASALLTLFMWEKFFHVN